MPELKSITIYPIKSLDGVMLSSVDVVKGGALQNDRRFALVDEQETMITAKRFASIHRLRTTFDEDFTSVTLNLASESEDRVFSLQPPCEALQDWLSGFFEERVRVIENRDGGLPDDTEATGPTIVSAATLEAVASWFPGLTIDEVRMRFRPNLVIDGVEPFWEDQLFAEPGKVVRFTIGDLPLLGINPCARCPVPTRNPWSGEVYPRFAQAFQKHREATLPVWAPRSRFDHFYRLTVNTRGIDGNGKPQAIRVGDEVKILGVENATK